MKRGSTTAESAMTDAGALVLVLSTTWLVLLLAPTQPAGAISGSGWNATASYPISVDDESCASSVEFVYCVGGFIGDTYTTNGTQSTTEAFYADPSIFGGVSSWTGATNYPTIVNTMSCVVWDGYIYCVGGYAATGITGAVYYARLLGGGGISQWNITSSYPVRAFGQSCTAWNGYIYCVGGYDTAAVPTNSVYFAKLTSAGLGPWFPSTSYPTNVTSQSCFPSYDYLYCVGGITDSSPPVTDSVYYSTLSSGGLSDWTGTANYPTDVDIQSCAASSNESVYCVGGGPNFAATNASFYGSLSPSGGVLSWSQIADYPIPIGEESCVTLHGYIYCVGGSSSASSHTDAVYFIDTPTVTSSNFTPSSTPLATLASSTSSTSSYGASAANLQSSSLCYLVVNIAAVSTVLIVFLLSSETTRKSTPPHRPRQA